MQQEFLPTQMTLLKSKVGSQSNNSLQRQKGRYFSVWTQMLSLLLSWRSTAEEEKQREEMVHYALQLTHWLAVEVSRCSRSCQYEHSSKLNSWTARNIGKAWYCQSWRGISHLPPSLYLCWLEPLPQIFPRASSLSWQMRNSAELQQP